MLNSSRLCLRALEPSDLNATYLGWLNDPEVNRYLETRFLPQTQEALQGYWQAHRDDPASPWFAICLVGDGRHIGNIKLDNFDWVNRTCELGLLLGDRSYWGKGVGTEVMRLTLRYAFDQLNMRKVVLAVYSNNPGAVKLYEKVGFQREGCLRAQIYSKGEYIDKYYMGIFSNELQ
jgi:RimJ/RimL family protein N-acetyltransferase